MTIIVTGGAGFIGSNFIFHMLNKYPDYRIVCLDCLTYAGNLSTLEPVMDNPNFRFVKEALRTVRPFTVFLKKKSRISLSTSPLKAMLTALLKTRKSFWIRTSKVLPF